MQTVSIIVPIYNAQSNLTTCIESLEAQTYPQLEIILVDDGSTDGSGKICDEYEKKDGRIKVCHRKNCGVSIARNYGLAQATGTYVLFADADDSMEKDTVKDNIAIAELNEADLVLFGFQYLVVEENKKISNLLEMEFIGDATEFFRDLFIPVIDHELLNPPWNKLIRKNLLDSGNIWFNPEYSICEDMAFSVEVLAQSKKIVFNNKTYYNYCLKSTGSLVFKFHDNYFEALTYFYHQALQYCYQFKEYDLQKNRLDSLYSCLGIMYVKQICCRRDCNKKEKLDRVKTILTKPEFNTALCASKLNRKKQVIRILVLRKKYKTIYHLYHYMNKIV